MLRGGWYGLSLIHILILTLVVFEGLFLAPFFRVDFSGEFLVKIVCCLISAG